MIPGEVITKDGDIELNAGAPSITLKVANTGDRPVQVGSHYHFYEANAALSFDRDQARGQRLNIAAGTAVRFEPGQERCDACAVVGRPRGLWISTEGDGKTLGAVLTDGCHLVGETTGFHRAKTGEGKLIFAMYV